MYYFWNKDRTYVAAASLTIVSVLISVVSYTKIILKLRQHQAQLQDVAIRQNRLQHSLGFVGTGWSLWSVCISASIIKITGSGETLIYLNSSLNPILYCWKITEV